MMGWIYGFPIIACWFCGLFGVYCFNVDVLLYYVYLCVRVLGLWCMLMLFVFGFMVVLWVIRLMF